jgi:SPX domain protein involved in polyphosphate accumulation
MALEVFNRYENKYMLNNNVYKRILEFLCRYMELDEHNKNNNFYTITNIYYDTHDDELIRKSISKPRYKEKLRLRAYGTPELKDKVYLEIKKKMNGLVNKRRTHLTLSEAYEFISTKQKPIYKKYMNKQVLNEIQYFLEFYELQPKTYISYDRMALFCKNNRDLRVTFDTNIRTRRHDLRLEHGSYGDQLLDRDIWLMEIKAENGIPLWLSNMLSYYKLYKVGFSKYGTEYKSTLSSKNTMEVVLHA